ncbi:MAG: hypothetical protein KY462_05175 [Actinobacteria bacterium]|nr:hypothetical protein [Actinomycetota bacterium]
MQLQARPGHRMLRCGRLVLVVDLHGQVDGKATEGLFVNNTRMLSRLQLRADGQRLATFAMSPTAANELVGHYQVPASDTVPEGSVFVQLRHRLTDRLSTVAAVSSYHRSPVSLELAFAVDSDFADSEEAEKGKREQHGDVSVSYDEAEQTLEFVYGHPSGPTGRGPHRRRPVARRLRRRDVAVAGPPRRQDDGAAASRDPCRVRRRNGAAQRRAGRLGAERRIGPGTAAEPGPAAGHDEPSRHACLADRRVRPGVAAPGHAVRAGRSGGGPARLPVPVRQARVDDRLAGGDGLAGHGRRCTVGQRRVAGQHHR